MKSVLIAYVSKTGTTEHAANLMSQEFRQAGLSVDVMAIDEVTTLDSYEGIVIGAPINGMQWHEKATQFVKTHADVLKSKKTAYYFMSYMLNTGRPFWNKKIQESLNGVSNLVKPSHMGMFNGRIEDNFPAIARWVFGIKKNTKSDLTNDDEVIAWARECVSLFINE